MFVKRPDGEYSKLHEFLDRDSLMLLSRFPELLPSYRVFEGGHFSVDHIFTKIGRDDNYTVARRSLPTTDRNANYKHSLYFISNVTRDESFGNRIGLSQSAFFRLEFNDLKYGFDEIQESDFQKIFSSEVENMEAFLATKTQKFNELTGYLIPTSIVVEDDFSEYSSREFKVTFDKGTKIPPHILNAFYVFLGLY